MHPQSRLGEGYGNHSPLTPSESPDMSELPSPAISAFTRVFYALRGEGPVATSALAVDEGGVQGVMAYTTCELCYPLGNHD